ncbi:unnamed protein product, partial [marine sediment metagenome]
DPLAPIRQQLMSLSAQVPGMVEARKAQIGAQFGAARERGLGEIAETVRGRRGWGPTSIQARLGTELRGELGRAQAGAELGAEEWGLSAQMRALGGAGGMVSPEMPEEEPWWQDVLGAVGETVGYGGLEDVFKKREEEPGEEIRGRMGKIRSIQV